MKEVILKDDVLRIIQKLMFTAKVDEELTLNERGAVADYLYRAYSRIDFLNLRS